MTRPVKNFLIVFPDEWLAYAPTLLNMAYMLEKYGKVSILTFWDDVMSLHDLPESIDVHFIKITPFIKFILYKIRGCGRLLKPVKFIYLISFFIRKKLWRKHELVFGVDSLGYLCSRIFHSNVIFLSLEVKRDIWLFLARLFGIENIAIQSDARKEFLLGRDSKTQMYLLPNSPIVNKLPSWEIINKRPKNSLIYFGNISSDYDLGTCIESLMFLDESYVLTLKGFVTEKYREKLLDSYSDLFNKKRVFIDTNYISEWDITGYLQNFTMGLCFYDVSLTRDFNVLSSPSGKMYNYFASGVPILGMNILGLQDVVSFNAGVLIDRAETGAIVSAVNLILSRYDEYVQGALDASAYYDFKKHFGSICAKFIK